MATPPLPDEVYQSAVDAYDQAKKEGYEDRGMPSATQVAAKRLGWDDERFRRRMYKARASGFAPAAAEKTPSGPVFPRFSDDDIPVEDIIAHLKKRVIKKMARDKEERWYTISLPDDRPFGGLIFGDQHMGTHCNWPLLESHCEIAKKTQGLYGINVGDLTDSWPLSGRLARLWAENDISLSTEWKLIDWFTAKAGITWLAYCLGNHDTFNTNALKVFEDICKDIVPVSEGEAKFIIRTPNGSAFPIWVRHDFKGHSQFNSLHGMMRSLREKADVERGTVVLGVQGHKHHAAVAEEEVPERGYFFKAVRARGYKVSDGYAKQLGFSEQEYGASLVYVCNPQAKNLAQMTSVWMDVEEGAEYLKWLRRRFK